MYCLGHGNPIERPGPAPSERCMHVMLIGCDQGAAAQKCMCVDLQLTHGCMASALGPPDVRPDFHLQDSTLYMHKEIILLELIITSIGLESDDVKSAQGVVN